jgi:predicted AAA+ superfamily ATPase
LGPLLETFVYSELLKFATVADDKYSIMHYRDRDQVEVDFVIERSDGTVVAVEVKASATIRDHDLRGLRRFAAGLGDTLKLGIILYDGSETVPLGDGLIAVPGLVVVGIEYEADLKAYV